MEKYMTENGQMGLNMEVEYGEVREIKMSVGTHGDSYIGEWKHSKAEGYGVHTWKNGRNISYIGDRYEGEWQACLKHGEGTDIFANGDIYVGNYKFGKRDSFQGNLMERDSISGKVAHLMLGSSKWDWNMEWVNGEREKEIMWTSTKEHMRMIKNMGTGYSLGLQEMCIKGVMWMMNGKEKERCAGLMDRCT